MCCSTDFLVCINMAHRNNGSGAREFLKLLLWIFREIWHIVKTLTVKSRIFARELGWSLCITWPVACFEWGACLMHFDRSSIFRFRHQDYDLDWAQKLISLSMSRHLSTRSISSKSMHAFLSNPAHRQTDRLTDRETKRARACGRKHIPLPSSEVNDQEPS